MVEGRFNGGRPLTSDLSLNLDAFDPRETSASTTSLNDRLIQLGQQDTKWWTCGAAEYRRRRVEGQTPFPAPVCLDGAAEDMVVNSDHGPAIKCRVFLPLNGQEPWGVFYHIHGGGYVLGSASGQDLLLAEICQSCSLVVVSVEYRLAPEHPFPAALEDCCTVAEWLVRHSQEKWRCEMNFIGGESAGATLSALVLLHLKQQSALSHIKGVVFSYGNFDLSALPSLRELGSTEAPILNYEDAEHFLNAYLPGLGSDQRKDPTMSPAYNNLDGLVPALFIVGTKDGLLDDSILMASRWQLAGNEAILKFVPGGCHGFMTFNGHAVEVTRHGWDLMLAFLTTKLGI